MFLILPPICANCHLSSSLPITSCVRRREDLLAIIIMNWMLEEDFDNRTSLLESLMKWRLHLKGWEDDGSVVVFEWCYVLNHSRKQQLSHFSWVKSWVKRRGVRESFARQEKRRHRENWERKRVTAPLRACLLLFGLFVHLKQFPFNQENRCSFTFEM